MRSVAYRLDRFGMIVACASCVLIFVFVLGEVVFRLFGRPLYFAGEYSEFLMAWLIFFALGEVTRQRAHLTVDFVTAHLSARSQSIVSAFADLMLMVIYVSLALWITAGLTWSSYSADLRSQGLMITPLYIPQTGMLIGLSICCLRAIVDFCAAVAHMARGTRP